MNENKGKKKDKKTEAVTVVAAETAPVVAPAEDTRVYVVVTGLPAIGKTATAVTLGLALRAAGVEVVGTDPRSTKKLTELLDAATGSPVTGTLPAKVALIVNRRTL